MTARCYIIDVDGEPVRGTWSTEPTDEAIAAFRELIRAVRDRVFEDVGGPLSQEAGDA